MSRVGDSRLCNKMHVCAEMPAKFSRRSIGAVRVGGFRNNVPIAKDRCILFAKKVGTARNLVTMGKKFESRHFSGPNIL